MSLAVIDEDQEDDPATSDHVEEAKVTFQDGRLFCVALEWERLPFDVLRLYGPRTDILDLSSNRLRELKGLECFTLLQELVVDNNHLGDEIRFPRMERLHTLSLNKNKVTNLDELLKNLRRNLPKLGFLSLLHNPLCPDALSGTADNNEDDYRRYRLVVLRTLTKLRFLDSRPVTERERREAQLIPESKLRAVRVRAEDVNDRPAKPGFYSSMDAQYSPLSGSLAQPGGHRGKLHGPSKRPRTADVRGSQGNKFISNSDL